MPSRPGWTGIPRSALRRPAARQIVSRSAPCSPSAKVMCQSPMHLVVRSPSAARRKPAGESDGRAAKLARGPRGLTSGLGSRSWGLACRRSPPGRRCEYGRRRYHDRRHNGARPQPAPSSPPAPRPIRPWLRPPSLRHLKWRQPGMAAFEESCRHRGHVCWSGCDPKRTSLI
jgi:hypothetical protein